MSMSATGRHGKIVVPETLHPEYRQILQTYLANLGTQIETLPCPAGVLDRLDVLEAAVDEQTACVLVQHPNFFGCLEEVASTGGRGARPRRAAGRGLRSDQPGTAARRPGDWGPTSSWPKGKRLGTPMLYGGPYLGIMACREPFVRRMPGRIAGQTVDRRGRRCWVLTLQTREQHIRRDKATSNICTNQGLFALRACIYLASLGPAGLRAVAELCLQKAHYAAQQLAGQDRFEQSVRRSRSSRSSSIRDRQGQVGRLAVRAPRPRASWPASRSVAGIRNCTTASWSPSPNSERERRSTGWRAASPPTLAWKSTAHA